MMTPIASRRSVGAPRSRCMRITTETFFVFLKTNAKARNIGMNAIAAQPMNMWKTACSTPFTSHVKRPRASSWIG